MSIPRIDECGAVIIVAPYLQEIVLEAVHYADGVGARGKGCASGMELKGDAGLQFAKDLSLGFAAANDRDGT